MASGGEKAFFPRQIHDKAFSLRRVDAESFAGDDNRRALPRQSVNPGANRLPLGCRIYYPGEGVYRNERLPGSEGNILHRRIRSGAPGPKAVPHPQYSHLCHIALKERVRRLRRPVSDKDNLFRRDMILCQQLFQDLNNSGGNAFRCAMSRRQFVLSDDLVCLVVNGHRVGERPSYVDPNPYPSHVSSPLTTASASHKEA